MIEDLTGFVSRMEPAPQNAEDISRRLQAEHDLKLPGATLQAIIRVLDARARKPE